MLVRIVREKEVVEMYILQITGTVIISLCNVVD